ncbi:MAG: hypothetical protein ABEH90_01630 [Halolamina sp.]
MSRAIDVLLAGLVAGGLLLSAIASIPGALLSRFLPLAAGVAVIVAFGLGARWESTR